LRRCILFLPIESKAKEGKVLATEYDSIIIRKARAPDSFEEMVQYYEPDGNPQNPSDAYVLDVTLNKSLSLDGLAGHLRSE